MDDRMDDVDWSGLFHGLGPASDTPRHVAALPGDDARASADGYAHLWSATLRREGKAWPSTAPTARLVAGLLDDPSLGSDDPSLPDGLLAYLHAVGVAGDLGGRAAETRARVESRAAQSRAWTARYLSADADARVRMWQDGTERGELVLDQAALGCFDLAPPLLRCALPHLASERGSRRACAAAAVGVLARHPSAAAQRPALVRRLTSVARAADTPHGLATALIAVGRLGGDTRPWLASPHTGVRVCAALAPGLVGDDAANRTLLELARFPHAFAESFGDMAPPPQLQCTPYQDGLTHELLRRVDDAEARDRAAGAVPDGAPPASDALADQRWMAPRWSPAG
ncbi:hypothetical protein ACIRBY_15170 [Streptomyces sp. NPDC096136]|uniref:hypothetical protein n=1 Tax=Streptomyces sp. NPDC096136 TaxID=3366076 RepID=UPI0037F930F6